MTNPPGELAGKPPARVIPQAVGIVADVAAVAALIIGGGKAIVWASSFGALVAGAYIVWRRWGQRVDTPLVGSVVIAVTGAAVFGYTLGTEAGGQNVAQNVAGADSSLSGSNAVKTPEPSLTLSPPPVRPPVTSSKPTGAVTATFLSDLPEAKLGGYREESADFRGTQFQKSLIYGPPYDDEKEKISYEAAGRFTTFEAMVFLRPGSKPPSGTESMKIEVLTDGDLVDHRVIRLGDPPQPIRVALQNRRWLVIQAHAFYSLTQYADTVEFVLANARMS